MPMVDAADLRERGFVVEEDAGGLWGEAFAVFDADRRYRYALGRSWGPGAWRAHCLLNPSTADAFIVDATITRCLKRAKADGFGGILVVNLFAHRSRHPTDLLLADDPVGPTCDDFITGMPENVWREVIVGWGCGPSSKRGRALVADRARVVGDLLAEHGWDTAALQVNADGSPKHPLYCKTEDVPTPWSPRALV